MSSLRSFEILEKTKRAYGLPTASWLILESQGRQGTNVPKTSLRRFDTLRPIPGPWRGFENHRGKDTHFATKLVYGLPTAS
jgi:hypothetical protein